MRKLKLFKSLVVAAAMILGGVSSAWADDYTSVYTHAAVTDWTNADKTEWNASSAVEINATYGIGANANSTATYVSKSFVIGENNKVKYEVDWTFATATGRTNNWNWIQFGDFLRIAVNSSYNVQVSTDGGTTWNATTIGYYYNTTTTKHITLIFDTATKTIESFSFDGTDRTALVSGTFTGKIFNSISTGFVRGGSVSWTLNNYITTVSVSEAAQAVTATDYTVNYKFGESIVKTVSSSSTVGTTITADAAVDGEGSFEGKHYLITAAEAPSMTLAADAASNILNVPVRAPYTATLNVTKTIGGIEETPVVTELTETDAKVCSWTYAYPMYVQKDGVYYIADETSSFGESGEFTDGQTINKTVNYTYPDYSVVYFGEPNEVEGTNIAYSNGSTGYITGGVAYNKNDVIRLGTLAAGEYHLITNVIGNPNRYVVVGDCSDTSVFPTALVEITTTGAKDEVFVLTDTTPISISGKDQGNGKFNQSADIDYILIKASTQSKNVTAAGWATYCSPYALDFSSAITNLDAAYIVTGGESGVLAKTAVTGTVPANTGLLLKGEGTVSIPVVASGDAANVSGNKLVGVTAATEIAAGAGYVLMASPSLGFYQNTNAFTVGANTAYLPANFDASGARFFSLDDTATEINAIEGAEQPVGSYYNLNGQRVSQPARGLYIMNGKKIVVR